MLRQYIALNANAIRHEQTEKGIGSCKNTPKIRQERKIRKKKKNLKLPPKQRLF